MPYGPAYFFLSGLPGVGVGAGGLAGAARLVGDRGGVRTAEQ